MSTKQSLTPPRDLRHPTVEHEQRRNPTKEHNRDEQHDESPGCDTELWGIEQVEGHPCTDVDEAAAIEDKVQHGSERLMFRLFVEISVPRDCGSYNGQSAGADK